MNYELKGMSILDTSEIDAGIVRACLGVVIDPSPLLPIHLSSAVLWMLTRTEYDHEDKQDQIKLADYILNAKSVEDKELRDKLRPYYCDLVSYIRLSKSAKAFNCIRVYKKQLLVVERWQVLAKGAGEDAVDIDKSHTKSSKKPKATKHEGGWTSYEF